MPRDQRAAAVLILLLLGNAPLAVAAPPRDRVLDPEISSWFRSLRNPSLKGFGGVCCDEADGRVLDDGDWRVGPSGYQVRIEGDWRDVPEAAVLARVPNPTGGAVLFLYRGEILCFVRPSEG